MTPETLRQDAARREALARAATPGPWTDDPVGSGRYGNVAEPEGCTVAEECAQEDRLHIAANDPPAVLASCDRDRLLADMAEFVARYFGTEHEGRPSDLLLARFDALGGPNA